MGHGRDKEGVLRDRLRLFREKDSFRGFELTVVFLFSHFLTAPPTGTVDSSSGGGRFLRRRSRRSSGAHHFKRCVAQDAGGWL
jgi:hypothetical protein